MTSDFERIKERLDLRTIKGGDVFMIWNTRSPGIRQKRRMPNLDLKKLREPLELGILTFLVYILCGGLINLLYHLPNKGLLLASATGMAIANGLVRYYKRSKARAK